MSFLAYLWGIRLFTFSALLAWLGVIILLDPEQTGIVGIIIFFVSLLALLTGGFTLLVTWIYRKGLGDREVRHHLSGAFRQASLLALYVLFIVFFQYARILIWWDALLLFVAVLLVELSLRCFSDHTDK